MMRSVCPLLQAAFGRMLSEGSPIQCAAAEGVTPSLLCACAHFHAQLPSYMQYLRRQGQLGPHVSNAHVLVALPMHALCSARGITGAAPARAQRGPTPCMHACSRTRSQRGSLPNCPLPGCMRAAAAPTLLLPARALSGVRSAARGVTCCCLRTPAP